MFFVYIDWVQMVMLRHEWFRSPEYVQSFYARTLTMLHVPKNFQSDEGLRAIFNSTKDLAVSDNGRAYREESGEAARVDRVS